MDYYEELGIDRTATEEEIRKAHRRLTKILHPDQQTDEAMKQLAETQMRRLNSVVETLSDPQRRQEYDEGLRGGSPSFQASRFRRRAFHSWPWWVGSTVGAVGLTVGVVWFSAERWGSSFGDHAPTYIPSGAETSSEPSRATSLAEAPPSPAPLSQAPRPAASGKTTKPPADSEPQAKPSRTVASVPTPGRAGRPANPKEELAESKQADTSKQAMVSSDLPRHRTLSLPLTHLSARPVSSPVSLPAAPPVSTTGLAHVETVSMPSGNLPAAPKLAEAVSSPAGNSAAKARDLLEGEWVYAPTEPEKRKAGFYPPEYIDLKIWNQGGLRGEYKARYHVSDKPIPPDVSFELAPDRNPRHFTWESSNGSKGTLKISSMDAGSIRIEWRTTVFTAGPALTAGTATLVRRTP